MNHAISTGRNILIANLSAVICFSLLALNACAAAAAEESVDRVTFKDGKVMVVQDGESSPLKKQLLLSQQIKVNTNGTFRVNNGKPRDFKEGQVLSRDGMLISPDGSIEPVMDHITMKNGKLLVMQDGESRMLEADMAFPDGSKLLTDGTLRAPDGRLKRLIDGELLTLDGHVLPTKDTITLQDGKVVVQKDGSLLRIPPNQSIMMNDGTKVLGTGTVLTPDGRTVTLAEGQIITVQGVALQNR